MITVKNFISYPAAQEEHSHRLKDYLNAFKKVFLTVIHSDDDADPPHTLSAADCAQYHEITRARNKDVYDMAVQNKQPLFHSFERRSWRSKTHRARYWSRFLVVPNGTRTKFKSTAGLCFDHVRVLYQR